MSAAGPHGSRQPGWGVVGTGDISRQIVADLRMLHPRPRIAIGSRSLERARSFADRFELERAHGSMEDLLHDPAVDIVYIGIPHSTHSTLAIQAIEAGKHVLVEKPMGIDARDAGRIIEAARQHDVFVMEGMWMKFHPYYRALVDDVRSGGLGELRSVRASFGLPFGTPHSERWNPALSSSTLLDQGIYPVTLVHQLFGEPLSIEASARYRDDGVDLSIVATLHFEGDRYAQVAASMVDFVDPSASINGDEGWISVPSPFWATDRYTRHVGGIAQAIMQPHTREFPREGLGYVPMLQAVEDAIGMGWTEHPLHTAEATLAVARLLDDIRETTRTTAWETTA